VPAFNGLFASDCSDCEHAASDDAGEGSGSIRFSDEECGYLSGVFYV